MLQLVSKKKIYFYVFSFLFLSTIINKNLLSNIKKIFLIEALIIKTEDIEIEKKILSELNYINNQNIFSIKKKQLFEKLKDLNFLENIIISKKYPSSIIVTAKKTQLIALTYLDNKEYYLGENGNFILSNNIISEKNLPSIFGKFEIKEFFYLKSALHQNNIDINSIKKYYFHKNKRWDLYLKNNLIIKLPNQNIDNAIKLFNKFQKEKKIKKNSIIDLRLLNRIIITHG